VSYCPFGNEVCTIHSRCRDETAALDRLLMDSSTQSIPPLTWARFEFCTQFVTSQVRDRFGVKNLTPYRALLKHLRDGDIQWPKAEK
jgi:hypothetical protein